MTFKEIYNKYEILPLLQQHMVRVAYVGKTLAKNATSQTNIYNIICACMLHDMGNIIKFNLETIPTAVEPQGLIYWQNIQSKFKEKYGMDEVLATHKIINELNVDPSIKNLIEAFGTRNVTSIANEKNLEKMIVNYSDHRVSPMSIESLKDRIEDQHMRFYKSMSKEDAEKKIAERKFSDNEKFRLEKLIFKKMRIKPENIKDIEIQTIMDEFLNIEI